ncbi:MAG: hypothetical protein ABIP55_12875 [Tepidisphaeraceae bacterium]
MARPHPTAKPSVNLASSGPRVSRIRRDPPPAVKKKIVLEPEEREQWDVIVGILAFALAIFVITLAFGSYSAWSPREYTVEINCGSSGSDC